MPCWSRSATSYGSRSRRAVSRRPSSRPTPLLTGPPDDLDRAAKCLLDTTGRLHSLNDAAAGRLLLNDDPALADAIAAAALPVAFADQTDPRATTFWRHAGSNRSAAPHASPEPALGRPCLAAFRPNRRSPGCTIRRSRPLPPRSPPRCCRASALGADRQEPAGPHPTDRVRQLAGTPVQAARGHDHRPRRRAHRQRRDPVHPSSPPSTNSIRPSRAPSPHCCTQSRAANCSSPTRCTSCSVATPPSNCAGNSPAGKITGSQRRLQLGRRRT